MNSPNVKQLPLALAIIIPFIVYCLTAPHQPVAFGDSDELVAAGYFFGLPHPPGYPLFNMLVYFFTHLNLPFSTVYKANFASILPASIALGVLYLLLERVSHFFIIKSDPTRRLIALALTLFLAFTPLYWTYATVTEVFALNVLLSLCITYVTLRVHKTWNRNEFLLLCFLIGLGVSHQQKIILVIIPSLLFLWQNLRKNIKTSLLGLAIAVLVPLLLYTALFQFANQAAPQSWKVDLNPRGMYEYVFRRDYAANDNTNAYLTNIITTDNLHALIYYLGEVVNQLSLPALILALAGSFIFWKKLPKDLALYFLTIFFLTTLLIGFYITFPKAPTNPALLSMVTAITQRMYVMGLPFFIVLFLPVVTLIIKKVPSRIIPLILILPIAQLTLHYRSQNLSAYKDIRNYAHSILENMPREAVLICFSDISCFSLTYTQAVEHLRQDVKLIPVTPKLQGFARNNNPDLFTLEYSRNPHRISTILSWALIGDRKVFVSEIPPEYIEFMGLDGKTFFLTPKDLVFEITKQPLAADQHWKKYSVSNTVYESKLQFIETLKLTLFEQYAKNGTLYARLALKKEATDEYMKALKLRPNDPTVTTMIKDLKDYQGDQELINVSKPRAVADILVQMDTCATDKMCITHHLILATFVDPTNIQLRELLVKQYQSMDSNDLVEEETSHIQTLSKIN